MHEEHVEVQFEHSSTLPIIILVSLTTMISPYSCNQLSLFECRQNPNNSAKTKPNLVTSLVVLVLALAFND